MTTTYEQLLERVITDGIAEVRQAYADPKEHHKRDGAIEGFEACRGKSPVELTALWHETSHATEQFIRHRRPDDDNAFRTYWKKRYAALQVEFVLNVVSVGLTQAGLPPLLAHLPTMRGAMKYAQIVGVNEDLLS